MVSSSELATIKPQEDARQFQPKTNDHRTDATSAHKLRIQACLLTGLSGLEDEQTTGLRSLSDALVEASNVVCACASGYEANSFTTRKRTWDAQQIIKRAERGDTTLVNTNPDMAALEQYIDTVMRLNSQVSAITNAIKKLTKDLLDQYNTVACCGSRFGEMFSQSTPSPMGKHTGSNDELCHVASSSDTSTLTMTDSQSDESTDDNLDLAGDYPFSSAVKVRPLERFGATESQSNSSAVTDYTFVPVMKDSATQRPKYTTRSSHSAWSVPSNTTRHQKRRRISNCRNESMRDTRKTVLQAAKRFVVARQKGLESEEVQWVLRGPAKKTGCE